MSTDLLFDGDLPDGTYHLQERLDPPRTPAKVRSSGGLVSGTFAFTRSRNVPFIDLKDPEARVHECTIDVQFNLAITDLTGTPAHMPELGCSLNTGQQQAHLVQKGPVRTCQRSLLGGGH